MPGKLALLHSKNAIAGNTDAGTLDGTTERASLGFLWLPEPGFVLAIIRQLLKTRQPIIKTPSQFSSGESV